MRPSRRSVVQAAALLPAAHISGASLAVGSASTTETTLGIPVSRSGVVVDARALAGLALSWKRHGGELAAHARSLVDDEWSAWADIRADRGHGPDDPQRDFGNPLIRPGSVSHEIVPAGNVDDLRMHPLPLSDILPQRFANLTTTSPIPGLEIIDRSNWTTSDRKLAWDCTIGSSLDGPRCRSDVGLRHAVVHHTVDPNDYSAGDVPDILEAIRRYHIESRGWDDIAYNFAIDRFGRVWQTRQGPLWEPVVGGHTTGFNTESVGVAVLGTFLDVGPPQAVIDSLGILLGWKLAVHGVDPLGSTVVRASGGDYAEPGDRIEVRNISGHKDNQITSCPGSHMYDRLPEIRAAAAELVPVFGYLAPGYTLDDVAIEGWAIDRFSPSAHVEVDVVVDGANSTITASKPFAGLEHVYPEAGAKHGFTRTIPIDLDTRSITATARADDGRSALLMDLRLYATFIDVEPDRFYSEAVYWLRDKELTTGTLAGLFEPRDFVTRAQMAVFLWRFMDRPSPGSSNPFSDVPKKAWYNRAVRWLVSSEITTGTSPATFAPDEFVTRGQVATFVWRLCGRIEAKMASPFEDVEAESYYEDGVNWMYETGITTGTSTTEFSPELGVTRGEMAVFLHRLATTPEPWQMVAPPSVAEF